MNDLKYFNYLDFLRSSGETNMFGAAKYLEAIFGLERKEARLILVAWMEQFGAREQLDRYELKLRGDK